MSISRREFASNSALLASLGLLPTWFAESLLAQTTEPVIRYNINSTDPEARKAVQMYRAGVAAMQLRKAHEVTSWQFQANIHGWPGQFQQITTDPEKEFEVVFATDSANRLLARKIWGTCPHGNNDSTISFLPWHRIYLYFFERILRAAAGEPSSSRLGLPYWNWTQDRTLPLAFREEVNGRQQANALYWDVRRLTVTQLSDPERIDFVVVPPNPNPLEVDQLLTEPVFDRRLDKSALLDFNKELEDNPHGFVHDRVGVFPWGMGWFEEAARDPVFWSHHCNLDRLWSHWRLDESHENPVDAKVPLTIPEDQRTAWSKVQHTFVDENGKEITLTNSQVLVTSEILNGGYVYDDIPQVVAEAPSLQAILPVKIASKPQPIQTLATSGPVEVVGKRADVKLDPVAAFAAPAPVTEQTLIIRNIAASPGIQDSLFGVYVNLPPSEQPKPDSPYYVGVINIFNALAAHQPMMLPPESSKAGGALTHGGVERRFSIGDALRRQGWKTGDPVKVTIAPIPQDNRLASPSIGPVPSTPSFRAPTLSVGGFDLVGR